MHSAFKVLVEEGTGRIIGAHLLGPGSDETINLFALAMRNGITADRLADALGLSNPRLRYCTHGLMCEYTLGFRVPAQRFLCATSFS